MLHYTTGVSIHWTGLLDWNTGLDYWTEVFSFFGQDSVVFGLLQIFDIWRPQIKLYFCDLTMSISCFMTVVVLLAFSNALANKLMIMASQFWALFDQI